MKCRVFILLLSLITIGYGYTQQLNQKVGSNPTVIVPSAALEVESTTQGFLPPRMTQAQMKAITAPPTGLTVYCTNCGPACFQVYNGTAWVGLCSGGNVVASCTANGFAGIFYNGNATSGTTFSTTVTNNSFGTATISFAASDLALSGVAGLSVGTPTPSSVTLNAGQSQLVTYPITGAPTSTGTLTGTWTKLSLSCSRTKEVIDCGAYTSTGAFLVFQCHNLGADETVDPFTPSWQLNGAYIQWGKRGPTTSWKDASSDASLGFVAAPTSSNYNVSVMTPLNFSTTVSNDNAWNLGIETNIVKSTTNDPCPNGYRLPTRNEWLSINGLSNVTTTLWVSNPTNYSTGKIVKDSNGTIKLYLPSAGYYNSGTNVINARSFTGNYWSSTIDPNWTTSKTAYILYFNSSTVNPVSTTRNTQIALSVRCIKDKQFNGLDY